MKADEPTPARIRVLVADDHPLMREALCAAIDDEADLQIVGEATNGDEAVAQALALKPDVTIMDLFMPGKDGLTAIAEIRAQNPQAHILALTSATEDHLVLAAVQAGALGYLMKDSPRTELLHAVRQVHQGNSFLPPNVARKLADSLRPPPKDKSTPLVEPLTEREVDVLKLMGLGESNKHIAHALGVSEGTIRTHVHNILGKLNLANRNQAILYAIREGIAKP